MLQLKKQLLKWKNYEKIFKNEILLYKDWFCALQYLWVFSFSIFLFYSNILEDLIEPG